MLYVGLAFWISGIKLVKKCKKCCFGEVLGSVYIGIAQFLCIFDIPTPKPTKLVFRRGLGKPFEAKRIHTVALVGVVVPPLTPQVVKMLCFGEILDHHSYTRRGPE